MNFTYREEDIASREFLLREKDIEGSFIVSIHPCGKLSDRVIELGLNYGLPFALMTCCHQNGYLVPSLRNSPDPRLLLYEEPADYFDLVRKRYIEESGRQCKLLEIPRSITPKNHILLTN